MVPEGAVKITSLPSKQFMTIGMALATVQVLKDNVKAVVAVKVPPATIPPLTVLFKEFTTMFWSNVIALLLAYTSSPTPGIVKPPSHVATLLQLPFATAYLVAMTY
ncbi:MAG: hypothetical protein A2W93_14135 [Bacteroidetes bacterium GWF2_43_63]|nr:MAG: hypothetical protein A2W94_00705 [Bacteroidetes bacterium GWE2_42_42]OFY52481.1 MAG: hypothetical protein A2W93_14135 [Bacteroidetes bacterium GWF2_43_63]HCB60862.1 hypothetical protein [Bacteroidales bacterium]HCY23413.1 hypothetical protein [Bacteroidales bacterium]